ncbi:MAG: cytochrome c oxidase subunit 2A [Chloroflexi bacterium]|nr:cytochrome c oxidase subunit 2A [Chloroflexota bacterium]
MKPEKAGNDFQPRGTLAVMALYALIILAVWLAIYFGLFLSRR